MNHALTHTPQQLSKLVKNINAGSGIIIDGTRYSSSETFPVVNPATGQEICRCASADKKQATAAVDAAAKALLDWRKRSPRERSEILRRAYDLLLEHKSELTLLISLENGKTLSDSEGEVTYAAEFFRWFSEEAVRSDGEYWESPAGNTRTIVTTQPVGVCALITPWNFPAAMATRKIAPALAAGCTVVLKPASQTPLTAIAICDLLQQAGLPDGVVNLVPSSHSSMISEAWLTDSRVRLLSFTGSTEVGQTLLGLAAKRVVKTAMELGGNASFIVGPGADVDNSVEAALIAKFRNSGQACTAANRFFVHRSVASEFIDKLAAKINTMQAGAAFAEDTPDIGPVVNDKARQRLQKLIENCPQSGGKIITQGQIPTQSEGFFVAPTLVEVSNPNTELFNEEIFGPIVAVLVYDDETEMINNANQTEHGLASYICGPLEWALKVAEQLETGMIGINRGLVSDPAAPFGGFKQSGIGREGGREGIREYQEVQYFSVKWQ